MHLRPPPLAPSRDAPSIRVLWLVALLPVLALIWHGPIVQWADYHAFADRRSWLGIPHAADVLSNLPFLFVGGWAFGRLRKASGRDPAWLAWRVFAVALMCTALGSAFYHWAPDSTALVGDRLPIAWACAALVSALLSERVDARWGEPRALLGGFAFATLSVAWWWAGDGAGRGDLRPYLYLQVLPTLLIPAVLLLRLAPSPAARCTASAGWWAVLLFYAAAKALEVADHAVLAWLGVVSGHTLKHLLAAAGAAWLLAAAVKARAAQER